MPKPEEKKTMTFRLPASVHRKLRQLASEEQRTIEVVATRAIVSEIARAQLEIQMTKAVGS